MGKKKKKSINISEIFEIKNDNGFLCHLDSWIVGKIPPHDDMSMDEFKKRISDIDVISKDIEKQGLEPELAFSKLAQALSSYLPNTSSPPVSEDFFNYHENLFLAVYYMDSCIYNDGADNFFISTDESKYQLTLEGLSIIGATNVKDQLELLRLSVFGEKYPLTGNERADLLDEDNDKITLLLDQFSKFYAKNSDIVNKLLVKWAKENKNTFL
jgi:hypothetical protein